MHAPFAMTERSRWLTLATLLLGAPAWANDAEIVLSLGRVEVRETTLAGWKTASVRQQLKAGDFVRTGDASQMALLMRDQTQVRLSQDSVFQIQSVDGESESTSFELFRGRMWAQAKQLFTGSLRATTRLSRPSHLQVKTATATIGIRGTDWEVSVDDGGKTSVAVFSGEVEVGNEQGQVFVGPNELATVEPGRAPVKILLTNAKDRVQWVTAYRPAPQRWLTPVPSARAAAVQAIESGDYASAQRLLERDAAGAPDAALLLADLYLFLGRSGDAERLLAPLSAKGQGDPMASALLARTLMLADRLDQADPLLNAALQRHPGHPEIALALADLARLRGDGDLAQRLFAEVTRSQPQSAEAWFGLGRVENERENVAPARIALDNALRLLPQAPGYAGERATLDALAGRLGPARAGFDDALARQPDDYLAWTGLGIVQLKQGQNQQALESFLKAGVLEPRFARAQLYVGVAYYQLGNRNRALESVRKAAELDQKDPLPYVMLGLMHSDALELRAAVDDARQAEIRMPNLKSLNQIANNQKGSANLGSSLSSFGLEEWATYYANQAYSPYWAGSHLFLADRYTGKFSKNSELFAGFLTDPTVFGASNRNASLVATPGHYGRVDLVSDRTDWQQTALIGTANGMTVQPVPIAYFISADLASANARGDGSSARGTNGTLGLGMRPSWDSSVFAFATSTKLDATLRTADLPNDAFTQDENRADLGFGFKLANDNQLWLKAGSGKQRNTVGGSFVSQSTADALNGAFGTTVFVANGQLDRFHSGVEQQDLQFRHAFSAGANQWAWGLEASRQERSGQLITTFTPARLNFDELFTVRADDAYLSLRRSRSGHYSAQVDLYYQRAQLRRSEVNTLDLLPPPGSHFDLSGSTQEQSSSEFNPRLGFKWQLADNQSLRVVAQKWRRPASAGTLGAVDTLGIAVSDRLPTAGGLYQRARLQYDRESGGTLFFQAFADRERVDNGLAGQRTAITDFELTQLESLRNRPEVFSPKPDLEETPTFAKGSVDTLGFAVNALLGARHSASARLLLRDSRQQGANDGLRVPYVPRSYLLLGGQWAGPERLLMGATAIYRGSRFRDDSNLDPLRAGWSFGLTGYWESADKRSTVQVILDNLLSNTLAAVQPDPHLVLRYSLRF